MTTDEGLLREQQILQDKVNHKLGENDANVHKALNDFKTLTDSISDNVINTKTQNLIFTVKDEIRVSFYTPENDYKFMSIHPNAMRQFNGRYNINHSVLMDYANGPEWKKDIAQMILNEHSRNTMTNERFLLRSVDNQLRGFLSSSFKRFNSADIIGTFLSAGSRIGLVPINSLITETKCFFDSIIPYVFPIRTEKNGNVFVVFGARASISDFGDGAYKLETYMINVTCWNGNTRETVLKSIHKGAEIPNDIKLSDVTYRAETLSKVSLTRDIIESAFGNDAIQSQANIIKHAASRIIDAEAFLKKLPSMGMLKEEIKKLENVFMANKPDDGVGGEMTLWKMCQGISAVSRDITDQRKMELDALAGKILTL